MKKVIRHGDNLEVVDVEEILEVVDVEEIRIHEDIPNKIQEPIFAPDPQNFKFIHKNCGTLRKKVRRK